MEHSVDDSHVFPLRRLAALHYVVSRFIAGFITFGMLPSYAWIGWLNGTLHPYTFIFLFAGFFFFTELQSWTGRFHHAAINSDPQRRAMLKQRSKYQKIGWLSGGCLGLLFLATLIIRYRYELSAN